MEISRINSTNITNYNKKVSFGAVIPAKALLNGNVISQSSAKDNQEMFASIMYSVAQMLGRTKKSPLAQTITEKFRAVDTEFKRLGTIRTIRKGYMKNVRDRYGKWFSTPVVEERFFATGGDASSANRSGRNIGINGGSDVSRSNNLQNETDICEDSRNRIPGIEEVIIKVASKMGKSGQEVKYKVLDVEFVKTEPQKDAQKQIAKVPVVKQPETKPVVKDVKPAEVPVQKATEPTVKPINETKKAEVKPKEDDFKLESPEIKAKTVKKSHGAGKKRVKTVKDNPNQMELNFNEPVINISKEEARKAVEEMLD